MVLCQLRYSQRTDLIAAYLEPFILNWMFNIWGMLNLVRYLHPLSPMRFLSEYNKRYPTKDGLESPTSLNSSWALRDSSGDYYLNMTWCTNKKLKDFLCLLLHKEVFKLSITHAFFMEVNCWVAFLEGLIYSIGDRYLHYYKLIENRSPLIFAMCLLNSNLNGNY